MGGMTVSQNEKGIPKCVCLSRYPLRQEMTCSCKCTLPGYWVTHSLHSCEFKSPRHTQLNLQMEVPWCLSHSMALAGEAGRLREAVWSWQSKPVSLADDKDPGDRKATNRTSCVCQQGSATVCLGHVIWVPTSLTSPLRVSRLREV